MRVDQREHVLHPLDKDRVVGAQGVVQSRGQLGVERGAPGDDRGQGEKRPALGVGCRYGDGPGDQRSGIGGEETGQKTTARQQKP
ncbi:hypothetical protein D3C77_609570 [compost metagenome]